MRIKRGRQANRALLALRYLFGTLDLWAAPQSHQAAWTAAASTSSLSATPNLSFTQPSPLQTSPPHPPSLHQLTPLQQLLPLQQPHSLHQLSTLPLHQDQCFSTKLASQRLPRRSTHLSIASFNCRTLSSIYRQSELVKLCIGTSLDIVALQEHRIRLDEGSGTCILEAGSGWIYLLSSASASGHGGVGFLVCPKLAPLILNFSVICPRIASLIFQLKYHKVHLFTAHAPTSAASEADQNVLEDFLSSLGSAVESVPNRDVVIISSDLNATLPCDGEIVKNTCGLPNFNAPHVMDLLKSLNLVAANGHLRQKHSKLLTFDGPQKRKTRLDYILLHAHRRSLIRRVQCIKPKVVNSDHRLLLVRLCLSAPITRPRQPPSYQWHLLALEPKSREFAQTLNRHMLKQQCTNYAEFVTLIHKTASKVIPRAPCSSNKVFTPSVLMKDSPIMSLLRTELLISQPNVRATVSLQKQLSIADSVAREAQFSQAVSHLSLCNEEGRHRTAWKVLNAMTQRKARPRAFPPATSLHERLEGFRKHFQQVLNQPTVETIVLHPPPGLCPPPSESFDCNPVGMREMWKAALSTPRNKAFGEDGISGAVLRIGTVLYHLRTIVNAFIDDPTTPPPAWLRSIVVAIPKKANAKTLDQHRGISLMSVVAKVVNKVLLNRLCPILNPVLLPCQSGFRPQRSTIEQICALRILIDRCILRKKTAVIVYVDFSKAFDSVDREALRQIIAFYGVPNQLSRAVNALFTGTSAVVRTPDGITEPFSTTSGILQGDTLAPFLFVLAIDYILRHSILPHPEDAHTVVPRRSSRYPTVSLSVLAYADDIALLADDTESAARMFQRVQNEGAKIGLKVNTQKTEFMALGISDNASLPEPLQQIKRCERFTYLGVEMCSSREAFLARRCLSWVAARKLSPLFNSQAPDKVKILFYNAVVEPVLLYGAESWVMDGCLKNDVDTAQRSLLRHTLNIKWPNRISNSDLLRRTQVLPASIRIQRRRLYLLGAAFRNQSSSSPSPFTVVVMTKSTGPYRPYKASRCDLRELMEEDVSHLGMTWSQAQQKAADKKSWETLIDLKCSKY